MKMASLIILIPVVEILFGTAIALSTKAGMSAIANPGPHGLTEVLYAFSSGTGNNGSAFGGLSANTHFYNIGLGVGHAHRALLDDAAHAGHRRLAGQEEAHPRERRHSAHRRPTVRRAC